MATQTLLLQVPWPHSTSSPASPRWGRHTPAPWALKPGCRSWWIKGPDNPTRHFFPIMSTKCCSGDGEGRKDKGGGGRSRSKTMLCVWQSCMWKMACDKERWCVWQSFVWKMACVCVWKLCVKESVWQSCVWKMVCDNVVWKMVWRKMVCDKVVCERWCGKRWWSATKIEPSAVSATAATQNEGRCRQVPGLPRETKLDVTKCHACHAKCRGVTGNQSGDQARHQSQPSAPSATPATQYEGGCRQVPRLPRETKGGCRQVPRLPRETKLDVSKCHACHAKCRGVTGNQSGDQARHQSQPSAPSATPATQYEGGCRQVPRLPRETKGGCRQVPRLPRETKLDVTKCHACHAKCRGVTGNQSGDQARHQSQPSAPSATPATQYEGGCRQVPRLPRETKGGCRQVPRLPCETKLDVTKCHACHAKCRGVTGDQSKPKRATRASPVP